jgi:hypothetical protein
MFDIAADAMYRIFYIASERVEVIMSDQEKQAWLSLIGSGLIWVCVTAKLASHHGWALSGLSAADALTAYVTLVALMIVVQVGISVGLAAPRRAAPFKDERDAAIAAIGSRTQGLITLVLVNLLILRTFAESLWPGQANGSLGLSAMPVMSYALVSTLFAAHLGKEIAIIWRYRS